MGVGWGSLELGPGVQCLGTSGSEACCEAAGEGPARPEGLGVVGLGQGYTPETWQRR